MHTVRSRIRRKASCSTWSRVGSVIAGVLIATSQAHAGPIAGTYSSPLGPLALEEKAGVVRGTIIGKSPCGLKPGTLVLEGSRLDDSITGTVKVCKTGPQCSGSVEGIVMLLVTRNGDVLSGAAHVEAGKCATQVGADGLSIRRQVSTATSAQKDSGKASSPKEQDTAAARGDGAAAESPKGAERAGSTPSEKRGDPPRGSDGKRTRPATEPGPSSSGQQATQGQSSRSPTTSGSTSGSANGSGSHASTPATSDAESPGSSTKTSGEEASGDTRIAGASTTDAAPPARRGDRKAAEKLAIDGVGLMQTGKIEEARALFEQATEIDPSYAEGWTLVGVTFYQRDRYDEALDMYKRALEANPGHHDAYYNIACIYARTDEKEKAFSYLQIALLNGYVDVNTISDDPDLKSLEGDERFAKLKAGDFFY
jgi:Flp pilus assembly protein TadD